MIASEYKQDTMMNIQRPKKLQVIKCRTAEMAKSKGKFPKIKLRNFPRSGKKETCEKDRKKHESGKEQKEKKKDNFPKLEDLS